jgi:hypothetical protein
MRTSLVAAGAAAAVALGGCGGDDKSASGTSTPATSADAPALDTVLDCLKVNGLDAKDQSSSTGPKIGIDYPGGRTVIVFEESAADAKAYASVAEANGETAIVKGSLAVTIPADAEAEADQPAIEECVAA